MEIANFLKAAKEGRTNEQALQEPAMQTLVEIGKVLAEGDTSDESIGVAGGIVVCALASAQAAILIRVIKMVEKEPPCRERDQILSNLHGMLGS